MGELNEGLSKPIMVPFADPKLESWVTVSNEDKVFDILPMTMDEESDDLFDLAKIPLELSQDKTPIFDGFDDLMRDLLEATIECVDEQCIVDESFMIIVEESIDVDNSNEGDDFQATPIVVLDQVGDGMDEILCNMKICHQFSAVDKGHQMSQFKQLESTIKDGIDVEFIEMNQWDDWISPIDIRNQNISTLSHGDPAVGDLMAVILYAIHGSQQNCKAWSCVSSMQPLSIANPLLTVVELDHSYLGRVVGCAITNRTATTGPKKWRNASKFVVQEVRRLKVEEIGL
ncbi:hypothetical protein V6N11_008799 [Hibiscus sabdariffa]|uniref:Uncharacterized protein n=1 Tax=Hibiscus sabdariffa TaxID=183260 RepID=A0ABR2NQQ1_9ROSI